MSRLRKRTLIHQEITQCEAIAAHWEIELQEIPKLVETAFNQQRCLIDRWGGWSKTFNAIPDSKIPQKQLDEILDNLTRSLENLAHDYLAPMYVRPGASLHNYIQNKLHTGNQPLVLKDLVHITFNPHRKTVITPETTPCSTPDCPICIQSIENQANKDRLHTLQKEATQLHALMATGFPGSVRPGQSIAKALLNELGKLNQPKSMLERWSNAFAQILEYSHLHEVGKQYITLSCKPSYFLLLGHMGENGSCYKFGSSYQKSKFQLLQNPNSFIGLIHDAKVPELLIKTSKNISAISPDARFFGRVSDEQVRFTNFYRRNAASVYKYLPYLAERLLRTKHIHQIPNPSTQDFMQAEGHPGHKIFLNDDSFGFTSNPTLVDGSQPQGTWTEVNKRLARLRGDKEYRLLPGYEICNGCENLVKIGTISDCSLCGSETCGECLESVANYTICRFCYSEAMTSCDYCSSTTIILEHIRENRPETISHLANDFTHEALAKKCDNCKKWLCSAHIQAYNCEPHRQYFCSSCADGSPSWLAYHSCPICRYEALQS